MQQIEAYVHLLSDFSGLVMRIPRERVLTESDGPFAQLKGRSILPWEVGVAVDALAECWESDPGSVGQSLGENLAILLAGASATSDS